MKRRGFSLIDLTTLLFMLILLAFWMLPALSRAREAARAAMCQNQLRQFGIGFNIFGERDRSKRYCTNAYDFQADGCPDTNSWVGNLISLGAGNPGKMLCPSNTLRGNEKLNQLIGNPAGGAVVTQTLEGVKSEHITNGFCKPFIVTVDPEQTDRSTFSAAKALNPFGTLANGDAKRLSLVKKAVSDGYNTNYAQSWFMARGSIRLMANSKNENIKQTRGNLSDQSGALAGVTVRMMERSFVAVSAIPLLGDAAPGDISEAVLSDDLGKELKKGSRLTRSYGSGPTFINSETITKGVAPPLQILSAYTTEGITPAKFGVAPAKLPKTPMPIFAPSEKGKPAAVTAFADDFLPLPDEDTYGGIDIARGDKPADGATDLNVHMAIGGYGGSDGVLVLQDTRHFSAVHGSGASKACNILYADCAVKSLYDPNGDSYINPGFPVTNIADPAKAERAILAAGCGYTNNRCEAAPADFYNGPVIDESLIREIRKSTAGK